MIEPTEKDLGRKVVYRPYPDAKPEEGVVIAFNAAYVFVRYGSAVTAQATSREDLEWLP